MNVSSMKWMECPANVFRSIWSTVLLKSPAVLLMLHLDVLSTIRADKKIHYAAVSPLALFALRI